MPNPILHGEQDSAVRHTRGVSCVVQCNRGSEAGLIHFCASTHEPGMSQKSALRWAQSTYFSLLLFVACGGDQHVVGVSNGGHSAVGSGTATGGVKLSAGASALGGFSGLGGASGSTALATTPAGNACGGASGCVMQCPGTSACLCVCSTAGGARSSGGGGASAGTSGASQGSGGASAGTGGASAGTGGAHAGTAGFF